MLATVFSVRLNCTLVRSFVLMKLNGCTFGGAVVVVVVAVEICLSASGRGGGGGPASCGFTAAVMMVVVVEGAASFTVTVTCGFSASTVVILNSDLVFTNLTLLVLLAAMLRKYSDGLINEFESLSVLENLGGMNGNTNCLLTKCGPPPVAFADDSELIESPLAVVTTTVDLSLPAQNGEAECGRHQPGEKAANFASRSFHTFSLCRLIKSRKNNSINCP